MGHRVMVMTAQGTWITDCTTSGTEAQERAKFLMGRVPAVKVLDPRDQQVALVGA